MNRSKAKRVGKSFEFLRFSVLASNPWQQSPFSSSWRCCGKGGALAHAVAFQHHGFNWCAHADAAS